MNEYKVSVTHTITVEAENEEDAEVEAMDKLEKDTYCEPDFHVEKTKELEPEPPDSCDIAKEKAEEDMLTGLS